MPFDDSQPFEVVDDNADFDPSKPFDVVGDSSEASEFDPGKPFSVVQPKESESGDTLRAPTRAEKIKGALRNISPNLFSTERTLIGDRPRGLIPALWEASKTSPLDTIPNIPEIKTNDGSIESKIENLPLNIAAGVGDFALGTARFLTSPQGMATSGVGGIGPIARRAIATVFTPLLTKQAAEKLGEASVTKDPRAAAEGAALALAAGGAGAHAVRGEPVMASAEPPEQPGATASDVPAVEPQEQPINPNELPQAAAEPLQPKEPVAPERQPVPVEPKVDQGAEPSPVEMNPLEVTAPEQSPSTPPKTSIKQAPEPEAFNSIDDIIKFRNTRLGEERALFQEQIGLNEQQAERLQGILARDGSTSGFEKTLTEAQRKSLNWFFDESEFNQKSSDAFKSWDYESRWNPEDVKSQETRAESADGLVHVIDKRTLDNPNSDPFSFFVGSAIRLLEQGGSQIDIAKAVDRFTTRNSGSAGDKMEYFKSLSEKIGTTLSRYGIKIPESERAQIAQKPISSTEAINAAQRVKLSAPEGATALRGTDSKGRTSVQPISAVAKGNPFQGADIVKLESGTIDRSGKFKPIEGDVEVVPKSMGGKAPSDPGEIAPAELAQLTQSITHLADASPTTQPTKAFDMGRALSSVKESASAALNGLKTVSAYLVKKQEGRPVWNTFKDILGDRHLALSESVHNARKFAQRALKEIPDKELQDALSNWVDTGGDEALLRRGVEESQARYKAGYERALKLTPEQKVFAENLKNYFTARLDDAQKAGILEDGIENYIHRIYEKESAWKKSVLAELGSGVFTGKPALAKARVFQYDFEAEQAGLKPIKSFVKRVMAYDLALNKAIADRQYVKANMEVRMPDGRPAIDVAGLGSKQLAEPGDSQATFINPKWKPSDPETPKKYRGDYVSVDHPALRKWKWVSADDKGNPTFVQGDVLVHPDAVKFLKPVLQSSAIRRNAVGRAALDTGSSVKQTMLDLSLFHPVQIAIHGFEHRSFKPAPEIDFTRPEVRGLVKGGLVVGETSGRAAFDEGLSGSSLTKHIPWLGPKIVELKDWIFQSYIPRLKISTGLAALERNRKAYPELSEAELYHQTAEQMNHAFGELNYEMMGRSKTMQDVLRLTALAPDFLEARTKFVGDAFTKYGKEQATALAFGALGLYVLARVLNKMISGQYHMELENVFSVIYKGKAYGLRTVQGDLIHAATDPQHFIRNRLNPAITRPIMEAIVGRDEFGRKRSLGQQAVDYAKTAIPISVKGMFQGREKTLFESLLNSTGLTVRRATANTTIQKKLRDWTTENKIQSGPGEFIYDPDKDQYRKIRLAALEGDVDGTRKEIEAAVKAGVPRSKIMTHFSVAVTRPMTGSRKNDLLFKQSLSDDDKATFEQARKERAAVYSIVRQASR